MKFAIITHVQHIKSENCYFGYGPYVREMNSWLKNVDQATVVAPLVVKGINPIHEHYQHPNLQFRTVQEFNITSVKNFFAALVVVPKVLVTVYNAMAQADHIHLRCPGNMGLLGAVVQIAFPKKKKTAKYAGNWDPKAKQPFTYKVQRWILSNTLLTKNMQVLVYGEWENQTKNIKPFFTATYSEDERQSATGNKQQLPFEAPYKFIFVGALSKGKQPLYAIQLVEALLQRGIKITLDLYGDGALRKELDAYITTRNLQNQVCLKGNQTKETLKEAYQSSHFLILPSKSEGWPKAVAEAMFWGCVPVVTPVSCVPYMLGKGTRGILLTAQSGNDVNTLNELLKNTHDYRSQSQAAQEWSQHYTTDLFEKELQKLLGV